MGLREFVPDQETVKVGNTEVTLTPVNMLTLAVLLRDHLGDLENIFDIYSRNVQSDMAVAQVAQYAIGMVKDAPDLAAGIIAHCSVEQPKPGQTREEHIAELTDLAGRLSVVVQIAAIKKIAELTFREAGGAKKFFEGFREMLPQSLQQNMIPSGT